MEFVIISDRKTIPSRFSHLLSGLEFILNHFFYQILFSKVIAV